MINTKGRHITIGLTFTTIHDDELILKKCNPGTPSARVPKWRENLRHARCTEIDGVEVKSLKDMVCIIKKARDNKVNTLQFTFSTEKFVSFNPQEGIPQIHYDQMNVIAANHHTARTGEKYWQSVDTVTPNITPNISKTAVPGLNDKHRSYT